MRKQASHGLGDRDLDLVRRIDAVCRRFEADYRAGKSPVIADYLGEIPEVGRSALRSELIGLEQELRRSDETSARPDTGPIADAPTIAPASLPSDPIPGLGNPSVHEEATVAPRDQATVDLGSCAPAPPDAPAPARVRYFGDYEIESELARGGMGVVFRARQISLNRPVALKMILAGQLANETDVKRFYTEAAAAANLDHPGVVPIYEVGQHEGQHYFSMGYVEGQSLAQRLADGPLPPREAAALLVKVAEAIEYAHRRGVIHRDLKPGNILLDHDGNPRVTDFGLAKRLQSGSGLTGSGQIMGTPSYMPPEQAGGNRGEVGPTADVYALGATLYALVIGRPPFQAATAMDTLLQVIGEDPVPPRRLNARVPRDLETIVLKCLEKDPARRYGSTAALAGDLRRHLAGEPIVARPVTRLERAAKWARRRPAVVALLGAVALVAAAGLAGVLWQWRAAVRARSIADRESRNARDQAEIAERGRIEAEDRRHEAELARAREREQTELAEQRLYDVRMNLLSRYWEEYNGALLQRGLDEQIPARPGDADRRGFEWFYWRRKVASGHVALKGHSPGVLSVVFSPDGRRLASAGRHQAVRVWDAANGHLIRTLGRHTGLVVSLAFSPDGRRIASGDGVAVRLWDVATGRETHILRGPAAEIACVAYSPDGRRIAAASVDRIMAVWDAETGRAVRTLPVDRPGHRAAAFGAGRYTAVAFSLDGRTLNYAAYDLAAGGTLKSWDDAGGRMVVETHIEPLKNPRVVLGNGVAFSPDGRRLASLNGDGTVTVWEAATGREVRTLDGSRQGTTGAAFSPDGRRIASAHRDGTLTIWDEATGREVRTLKGHIASVRSVAFSPDGQRIASADSGGTVMLWDASAEGPAEPGTVVLNGHRAAVDRLWFSPDGRTLISVGRPNSASLGMARTVISWNAETWRVTRAVWGSIALVRMGTQASMTSAAISRDGRNLATADRTLTVDLWDLATGRAVRTLAHHAAPATSVAFSPDGRRFASGDSHGTVKLGDVETGREIHTFPGFAEFATARRASGAVTDQDLRDFVGHGGLVASLAFSPDGRRIASAGWDGTIKLWDAETGRVVGPPGSGRLASTPSVDLGSRLPAEVAIRPILSRGTSGAFEFYTKGPPSGVTSVAFSPDGLTLASADGTGLVIVWNATTLRRIRTLAGHTSEITQVVFSPDGRRLASAGRDGAVKLWDAATGIETLTLKDHGGAVLDVAFSPDGHRLASAGADGTVRVRDARPLDDEPARPSPTSR